VEILTHGAGWKNGKNASKTCSSKSRAARKTAAGARQFIYHDTNLHYSVVHTRTRSTSAPANLPKNSPKMTESLPDFWRVVLWGAEEFNPGPSSKKRRPGWNSGPKNCHGRCSERCVVFWRTADTIIKARPSASASGRGAALPFPGEPRRTPVLCSERKVTDQRKIDVHSRGIFFSLVPRHQEGIKHNFSVEWGVWVEAKCWWPPGSFHCPREF